MVGVVEMQRAVNFIANGLLACVAFAITDALSAETAYCSSGVGPESADILIITGKTDDPAEQPRNLKRALEQVGLAGHRIELKVIDESDRSRIPSQLDRSQIEDRFAVVTLSGHIAQVLSEMKLRSPTIFVTIADPLSWPIVDSLGARKANVTGISWIVDLEWKFLELLKLGFPKVKRVGLLADRWFFERGVVREIMSESLRRQGIEVVPFVAESREELDRAFTGERWRTVDAWIVPETPVVFRHEERVLELLKRRPVPTMFGHPSLIKKGASMAFGVQFRSSIYDEIAKIAALLCGGVEARNIPVVRAHEVFFGVSPTNIRAMGLQVDPRIYRLATFWH